MWEDKKDKRKLFQAFELKTWMDRMKSRKIKSALISKRFEKSEGSHEIFSMKVDGKVAGYENSSGSSHREIREPTF